MFSPKTFNGKKDCSGYGKPETPPKEAKCLKCRDIEDCKEKAGIWE